MKTFTPNKIRFWITVSMLFLGNLIRAESPYHTVGGCPQISSPAYLGGCGKVNSTTGNTSNQGIVSEIRNLFSKRCATCHSPGSLKGSGRFSDILDRSQLVSRKIVVEGDPSKSILYERVFNDEMPLEGDPLTSEEKAKVFQWIQQGAPELSPAGNLLSSIGFISEEEKNKCIALDLRQQSPSQRPFTRYFTLTNLWNAGKQSQIPEVQQALSRLLNSLSWKEELAQPIAIDPTGTIFRINLNDLKWEKKNWDLLLASNPFRVLSQSSSAKDIYDQTRASPPDIRADWFIRAAARPPLYHNLLELPGGDGKNGADKLLEEKLGVNVAHNYHYDVAIRGGFKKSGVSSNNRIVERHPSRYGAYWKSSDFETSDGAQNIFEHPLDFKPSGGEYIFNLPNGLQGYMITNADGKRIDDALTEIVTHPNNKRDGFKVVNGASCMDCHSKGMNAFEDKIRALALVPKFSAEKNRIERLYKKKEEIDQVLRLDSERFRKAIEKLGGNVRQPDPVFRVGENFEESLDFAQMAAELGVTLDVFQQKIVQNPTFARSLSLDVTPTINRNTFNGAFGAMIGTLNLVRFIPPTVRLDRISEGPQNTKAPQTPPVVEKQQRRRWDCSSFCYVTYAYGSTAATSPARTQVDAFSVEEAVQLANPRLLDECLRNARSNPGKQFRMLNISGISCRPL